MIVFKRAGIEDIECFRYDGAERGVLEMVDIRKQLETYAQLGHMWVTVVDNVPVAVYGLFECSPGVLQCWMLFNQDAARYSKSIIKEMKSILEKSLTEFHRIQTYLFLGDKASKYLKVLGFKKEAVLKSFGPARQDAEIYSMVAK
jgi:hypothetical protein